jgi:chorismate lyase / 3-hydroxybenzoate synthase
MSSDLHFRKPSSTAVRFLKLEYRHVDGPGSLPANVLAIVRFGTDVHIPIDGPLTIDVSLAPLNLAPAEIWFSEERVSRGQKGLVNFACDPSFLFGVIEVQERQFEDVREATAHAYAEIQSFQKSMGYPHLLRMWNFLDAVNEGEGDMERYRQFCIGRAQGLGSSITGHYPAATAIGRQHPTGTLQVFWIAGKEAGAAIENPRQVSAYRYPRAHGPVSPSFSRATVSADGTLLISGTASIVGHASQHPEDVLAQLNETLLNLEALIQHARKQSSLTAASAPLLLKVYVRDAAAMSSLADRLRQAFPKDEMIFLAADICRRELLLEIECVLPPNWRAA